MIDYRVSTGERYGGHSATRMEARQTFDYRKFVEETYAYLLDAAARKGMDRVQVHLREDMRNSLTDAERFRSSHQLIRVTVDANTTGSIADQKGGYSQARAEMFCRCFAPRDLQAQVASKYSDALLAEEK